MQGKVPQEAKALLSIMEAAELLGIKRRTFYYLLEERQIDFVQIGSRRLIRPEAIEEYIQRNTVKRFDREACRKQIRNSL